MANFPDTPGTGLPHRRTSGLLFIGITLLAAALYYATCMPGVGWQDSAMFQYRLALMDLQGNLGLALAHPFYILYAKAVTLAAPGDFAFRVNLASAFAAAAAVGICASLVQRLTRSALAGAIAALVLAVSHTFWTHAVIAEVYSLYSLCLLAELWLVERFVNSSKPGCLLLALFVNGLNLANHDLALLHAPAYLGLIVWALRRGRLTLPQFAAGVLLYIVGALPFLYLIASAIHDGQPALAAIREALTGKAYAKAVFGADLHPLTLLAKTVSYFALNFPTPLALLAPWGAWQAWKNPRLRWFAWFGGCIFVVNFIFAFRYQVVDQYVFFTPDYALFAIFIGLGLPSAGKIAPARALVFCVLAIIPVAVYEFVPGLLRQAKVSLGLKREIPFRDNYAYFLRPRKNGDDGALRFARVALNQAGPAGLIIADDTINNLLAYVRDVQGMQPGVTLVSGHDIVPRPPLIDASVENVQPFVELGHAYVCSDLETYVPPPIFARYEFIPVGEPPGVVYRLRPR